MAPKIISIITAIINNNLYNKATYWLTLKKESLAVRWSDKKMNCWCQDNTGLLGLWKQLNLFLVNQMIRWDRYFLFSRLNYFMPCQHPTQALVWTAADSLHIHLPARVPGKAREDEPSAWDPDNHEGELEGSPYPWLHFATALEKNESADRR